MTFNEQKPAEVFTRIPQDAFINGPSANRTKIHAHMAQATEGLYSAIESDISTTEVLSPENEMTAFLDTLPLGRATYNIVRNGRIHAALHAKLLLPFLPDYPLVINPLYLPEIEVQTVINIHGVVAEANDDYTDDPTDRQGPKDAELSRDLWAASYILDDIHVRKVRREHVAAAAEDRARHERRATILGVSGAPVQQPRVLGIFKRPDAYDYTTPEKITELKVALAEQLKGANNITIDAYVRASTCMWALHGYDALSLNTASDNKEVPTTSPERVPMSARALGAMLARSQI